MCFHNTPPSHKKKIKKINKNLFCTFVILPLNTNQSQLKSSMTYYDKVTAINHADIFVSIYTVANGDNSIPRDCDRFQNIEMSAICFIIIQYGFLFCCFVVFIEI